MRLNDRTIITSHELAMVKKSYPIKTTHWD
jgi:hypothetical protein